MEANWLCEAGLWHQAMAVVEKELANTLINTNSAASLNQLEVGGIALGAWVAVTSGLNGRVAVTSALKGVFYSDALS
jgi:hypothetical protein